jgi:hypothetical protein
VGRKGGASVLRWEAFDGNQGGGKAREAVFIFVFHGGRMMLLAFSSSEAIEEFGKSKGADLFENGWLGELG